MRNALFILNGPNLNLLGERETDIYGKETLADIEARCRELANELGRALVFFQSNHEGALVDKIHEARGAAQGMIINAGAFTHTSIAIHDALMACNIPIVELHISNVFRREEFRHHSHISKPATAVMCGFGTRGYDLAIRGLVQLLESA